MCGIFGYVGAPVHVGSVVLGALQSMEYRGYDSWGVVYSCEGENADLLKQVGRVTPESAKDARATSAIGHTRWATHGEVCERNAHPHLGCGGRLAIVHNGIIENADAIRARLGDAHRCASDTDSELMVHLIELLGPESDSLTDSVQQAFELVHGNNAFVVLDRKTEEVVAVTRRLPIRLGDVAGALVLASDPAALAGLANATIPLPDSCAVSLGSPGRPTTTVTRLLRETENAPVTGLRQVARNEPGASMRSEIEEQPALLAQLADNWQPVSHASGMIANAERVIFTGCGSAFNAARYAADAMTANGAGPTAVAWPASEVESSATLVRDTDAVVALSQSGETADVLDALTVARERGATTVGLINAEHSSAERLLDLVVPLCAGHERSVLATKSFMAMLARLWQLVHEMNGAHPDCTRATLLESAELVRAGLREPEAQQWTTKLATSLASRESAMVVSGGAHLPIADEAALKIKEGTYVHAESVRTGELKHGVIALVEAGYPCLLMAPDGQASNRLGIAAEELRTRGADVYWVGPGRPAGLGTGGPVISSGSPFVQTALIQRVALETALQRGVDPDYPRNLAKSVTVR